MPNAPDRRLKPSRQFKDMAPSDGTRPEGTGADLIESGVVASCRAEIMRLTGGFGNGSLQDRLLIAVSGGADSLALLLIAHRLWPDQIIAATVDHQLRPDAQHEAHYVAQICAARNISHSILTPQTPISGNLQSAARRVRYALLADYAGDHGCQWIATAHHADDQLETMLMRLARGSGLDGLAAIRARYGTIIRPLLGVRKADLVQFCTENAIDPVADPSNLDPRFDRVRIRSALRDFDHVDPVAANQSAAALSDALDALNWTVARCISQDVRVAENAVMMTHQDYPPEILRRLTLYCLQLIQPGIHPRGAALDRLLHSLCRGDKAMLGDVLCTVVDSPHHSDVAVMAPSAAPSQWRFERAPARQTAP